MTRCVLGGRGTEQEVPYTVIADTPHVAFRLAQSHLGTFVWIIVRTKERCLRCRAIAICGG